MRQFSFFRIVFGLYLGWHFAALIPYAGEIFSSEGIMGSDGLNPFEGRWVNPFFVWRTPSLIQGALILGVCASVLLMLGKCRRPSALFLWLLHSCLFTANPLTANPSLGYIGMLLLLCAVAPNNTDHLPRMIPVSAWILLAAGYSFSGILKLGSPSWIDGTAIQHLMHNPLARPGLARDIMLSLPDGFLMAMTWGALALEVFFIPLAYFHSTRLYAWSAMLLMHVGIMATVDFADLSLGMIMVHIFTFQKSWLATWKEHWKKSTSIVHSINERYLKIKIARPALMISLASLLPVLISSCSQHAPHNGIFPFSAMEKPPSRCSVARKTRKVKHNGQRPRQMQPVANYRALEDRAQFPRHIAQLRPGDVIAFYMSHKDARRHLTRFKIQKLPYEVFRYGHVSVIVPDPAKKLREQSRSDLKLLQVAMKQAVTASNSLDDLKDKSWIAYRPPIGSIDVARLQSFSRESILKCYSPKTSYDFSATFGLGNGNLRPRALTDVRDQYTCATLIVAALSYSGFDLYAERRHGLLDILTPQQTIDAWGVARNLKTP